MKTSFAFCPRRVSTAPVVSLRIALVIFLVLISTGCKQLRTGQALPWPTSTPEKQGMHSSLLIGMLNFIDSEKLNVHSILVMRHKTVVMEVYYPPFTPEDKQMQFSITKSFTSALFGIASGEGKIMSIDQPFLDYFKGFTIQNMSEQKQKITVRDLLNMTSGLAVCDNYGEDAADIVQVSLDKPSNFEPGKMFQYNPCNSILLAAILQKQTGMTMLDYAKQKLFGPLGIKDVYWAAFKNGQTEGNIGLMLKPRDMLKFGMLYNQNGMWEGKQIIPAKWVADTFAPNDNGYAYQWWQDMDGRGASGYSGQRIFVYPEKDLVIVVTGEFQNESDADTLGTMPVDAARSDEALPESPNSTVLAERIKAIENPKPGSVTTLPEIANVVNGKTIQLSENPLGWQTAILEFKNQKANLAIITKANDKPQIFTIGLDEVYRGTQQKAVTNLAVPKPTERYDLNPFEFNFIMGVPVDGTSWMKGAWTGADTFTLTVQDSRDFDLDTLTFKFSPPSTHIEWFSVREGENQMTFEGQLK